MHLYLKKQSKNIPFDPEAAITSRLIQWNKLTFLSSKIQKATTHYIIWYTGMWMVLRKNKNLDLVLPPESKKWNEKLQNIFLKDAEKLSTFPEGNFRD